jgi:hypothetical protein
MRKDSCLYVVAVVAVAVAVAETDAHHGWVGCDLASVTCIVV